MPTAAPTRRDANDEIDTLEGDENDDNPTNQAGRPAVTNGNGT